MSNARNRWCALGVTLIAALGLLAGAPGAWADGEASGRVVKVQPDLGTAGVNLDGGDAPQLRDVYRIERDGRPIGEAMVCKVAGRSVTLMPKAQCGALRVGDSAVFLRHAATSSATLASVASTSPPASLPSIAGGSAATPPGWVRFSLPEGAASVAMPVQPTRRQGATSGRDISVCKDPVTGVLYGFSCSGDVPQASAGTSRKAHEDALIREAQALLPKQLDLHVSESHRVEVNGFAALWIDGTQGNEMPMIACLVLGARNMYVLLVGNGSSSTLTSSMNAYLRTFAESR